MGVNIKWYAEEAKKNNTSKNKSRKPKARVTHTADTSGDREHHKTASKQQTFTSRKGRAPNQQTQQKYSRVGEQLVKREAERKTWREETKPKLQNQRNTSYIHPKGRNTKGYAKATGGGPIAKSDSGKLEHYKSKQDFFKQNPKAQETEEKLIKGEYKNENQFLRGAKDQVLENAGMEDKATGASRRIGKDLNKSTEVKEAKESSQYEAGGMAADVASYLVPGMAQEKVAGLMLSKGGKALKTAMKSRGGVKAEKLVAKAAIKEAKVAKKATESAAKKSVKEFGARRASDVATASPVILGGSASSAHESVASMKKKKGESDEDFKARKQKEYNKLLGTNVAMYTGGTLALGGLMEGSTKAIGKAVKKEAQKEGERLAAKAALNKANSVTREGYSTGSRKVTAEKFEPETTTEARVEKTPQQTIKETQDAMKRGVMSGKVQKEGYKQGSNTIKADTIKETPKPEVKAEGAADIYPDLMTYGRVRDGKYGENAVPQAVSRSPVKTPKGVEIGKDTTSFVNERLKMLQRQKSGMPKVDSGTSKVVTTEKAVKPAEKKIIEQPKNVTKDIEAAKKISKTREKSVAEQPISEREPITTEETERVVGQIYNRKNWITKANDTYTTTLKKGLQNFREMFVNEMAAVDDFTRALDKNTAERIQASMNGVRQTETKANYQIVGEQTNLAGNKVAGRGLVDIYDRIGHVSDDVLDDIELYARHMDNVDRWAYSESKNKKAAAKANEERQSAWEEKAQERIDKYAERVKDDPKAVEKIEAYKEGLETKRPELVEAEQARGVWGEEVSAKESQKILKEIEDKYKGTEHEGIFFDTIDADGNVAKSFFRERADYSLNQLEWLVDSRCISRAEADIMKAAHPNHLAAYRTPDNQAAVTSYGVKKMERAKGSAEKDMYSSLQEDAIETATNMQRCQANQFMNDLADTGKFNIETVHNGENGADLFNAPAEADLFPVEKGEGTITVGFMRDGNRCYIELPESMGKEIERVFSGTKFETKIHNWKTVTASRKMAKVLKELSTSYSPTFPIKNFIRDTQTALINSKDTVGFVKNQPFAAKEMASGGDWYKAYCASGAKMSSLNYKQKGVKLKADRTMKDKLNDNTLGRIDQINSAFENYTRFSEFCATLKKAGVENIKDATPEQIRLATLNASDISVNFGRSGYVGKVINQYVPFFNAGIQGISREYRLITEALQSGDGKVIAGEMTKLGIKATLFGVAPGTINELLALRDKDTLDEYNTLPANIRATNFCFKIGNTWIRIPKGRINSILGIIGQKVSNNENYTMKEIAQTIENQAAPADVFEDNIFMPIVNAVRNKTWYGGKILSDYEMKKIENGEMKAGEAFDETSSAYAKLIGKYTNWSPKKIDAVLDQYFSSWAKIAHSMSSSQASFNSSSLGDNLKNLGYTMVGKDFTYDAVGKNNLQTKMYEKYEGLQKELGKDNLNEDGLNKLLRKGKISEKKKDEVTRFLNYKNRVYDINDALTTVNLDTSIPRSKKLETVKKLQTMRNKILLNEQHGNDLPDSYQAKDFGAIRKIMGDEYCVKNIYRNEDSEKPQVADKIGSIAKKTSYSKAADIYEKMLEYNNSNYTTTRYGNLTGLSVAALGKMNASKSVCKTLGADYNEVKKYSNAFKKGVTEEDVKLYASDYAETKKLDVSDSTAEYFALAGKSKKLVNALTGKKYTGKNAAYSQKNHDEWQSAKYNAMTTLKNLGYSADKIKSMSDKTGGHSPEEVTKYIENNHGSKSTEEKSALWSALMTQYGSIRKNPYGSTKAVARKTNFKGRQVPETSKTMPTVIDSKKAYSPSYTKQTEKNINKGWLQDKQAIINKAKALAAANSTYKNTPQGNAIKQNAVKELAEELGRGKTSGMKRATRQRFVEDKSSKSVGNGTSSSSSGGRGYSRGYSRGGKKSGSSHSSVGGVNLSRSTQRATAKQTKSYGLTEAQIRSIMKSLTKTYGERAGKAYLEQIIKITENK